MNIIIAPNIHIHLTKRRNENALNFTTFSFQRTWRDCQTGNISSVCVCVWEAFAHSSFTFLTTPGGEADGRWGRLDTDSWSRRARVQVDVETAAAAAE